MPALADLLSWADNKRRVVGRNLSDLVQNPSDYLSMTAANIPQTVKEYGEDPMNFIGGGAGTFIGKGAKTWQAAEHARAQQMAAEGVDPRTIWKETGNWRGPDGHWRQEIPDNKAKLRLDFESMPRYKDTYLNKQVDMPIGGVLDHPDLYRAYPEMLRKIRVSEIQKQPDWIPDSLTSGGYRESYHQNNPAKIDVRAKTGENAKSMLMHEIQHDIQQAREMDWARGGNESSSGGFDAYRNLAGEAEARATQSRMNLTPEQRRALFPEDSYDVPIDKLILRRPLSDLMNPRID